MKSGISMRNRIFALLALVASTSGSLLSQETPLNYEIDRVANVDYSHGQLPSVMGVHNIQIMRANREHPELAEGFGWTYSHAPMVAYWNQTFYVSYLSDPVGEHVAPGQTYLQRSSDGYQWDFPEVLFPTYRIPDGTTKEGKEGLAKDLDAVMHQRMGFYVSKASKRLFALGFYGICLDMHDKPNDGKGIGRVIREIKEDGTFGDIYFIRYNHGWGSENTSYPFYQESRDKGFVDACEEMLSDPLVTLQWVEEADRDDPIIPKLLGKAKAFCYYTLPDDRIIGMFKSRRSGVSHDGGKTWSIGRSPGLITGSAKMWGQRTSDGLYAQVFNPASNRWPMAISVSQDGLLYDNLSLLHGDVSPKRYRGQYKSDGPQYLRGILPGNGMVPDENMWLTYSVNKEDIWVSRVTVPIKTSTSNSIREDLSDYTDLSQLSTWNIYSPVLAPVSLEEVSQGRNAIKLMDRDRYDYARLEHLFPESENFSIEFSLVPEQNDRGQLQIELQNDISMGAFRLCFDPDGMIRVKSHYKYEYEDIIPYTAGERYDIRIDVSAEYQEVDVYVNGMKTDENFYAPMKTFSKIVFRTGDAFGNLDPEEPARLSFDLEDAGSPVEEASYYILNLTSEH